MAIDLTPFATPMQENAFGKIWEKGEYTYASEGSVIVRVPRVARTRPDIDWPDVTHLPWDHAKLGKWYRLRDGVFNRVFCLECGRESEEVRLPVAWIGISRRLYDMLLRLPNVKCAVPEGFDPLSQPIRFRFRGGVGLMMALRPVCSHVIEKTRTQWQEETR